MTEFLLVILADLTATVAGLEMTEAACFLLGDAILGEVQAPWVALCLPMDGHWI